MIKTTATLLISSLFAAFAIAEPPQMEIYRTVDGEEITGAWHEIENGVSVTLLVPRVIPLEKLDKQSRDNAESPEHDYLPYELPPDQDIPMTKWDSMSARVQSLHVMSMVYTMLQLGLFTEEIEQVLKTTNGFNEVTKRIRLSIWLEGELVKGGFVKGLDFKDATAFDCILLSDRRKQFLRPDKINVGSK